jgi:S1-C subfamily serine protease
MDKIVISSEEITEAKSVSELPGRVETKLAPAIAWWLRFALTPLALVLPLLCLVTIVLRAAFRTQPPRTRFAWNSYLSSLLVASGLLTSLAGVLIFSFAPLPAIVSTGLAELDERTSFPMLPYSATLPSIDAARQLKSLVAVVSPAAQTMFSKREALSNEFGAGVLLQATSAGYLFATARHVVGGGPWSPTSKSPRALISMASGVWAGADVIARHTTLDLVLLWLPRHSGQATFTQPIAQAQEGQNIWVIGHPEGLKFTISAGIVSRMDNDVLQISAPVSPGNSGGPVYDQQGNLVGVVNSTMDKSISPNAENLNFAVQGEALLHQAGWELTPEGERRFSDWVKVASASASQTK